MAPEIENALPPQWRLLFQIVTLPVSWIPAVQAMILGFIWDYSSSPEAALKFMLFLLPALHVIAGMWCTMAAVYTLPFRGGRNQFVAVVLSTWWDGGRAIGMYWAGIIRAVFVTAGFVWGFIRILAAGVYLAIVELITLPFSLLKQVTKKTLRPGIPWIAVTLTIAWCILEGGIFSVTLYPTVSDITTDLMGGGGGALPATGSLHLPRPAHRWQFRRSAGHARGHPTAQLAGHNQNGPGGGVRHVL